MNEGVTQVGAGACWPRLRRLIRHATHAKTHLIQEFRHFRDAEWSLHVSIGHSCQLGGDTPRLDRALLLTHSTHRPGWFRAEPVVSCLRRARGPSHARDGSFVAAGRSR